MVQSIVEIFLNASGIRTSFRKCVAYSVACNGIDLKWRSYVEFAPPTQETFA
jgi:hypothetical protein